MALEVMRSETKYLLSRSDAARIKEKLLLVMKPDSYSENGSYRVRSLYFDTPDLADMFDKDVGAYSRKKVRLRIYDTAQENAKLELKEKRGGVQRKRSVWVTRAMCERLRNGDLSVLANRGNEFLDEMYLLMTLNVYRPYIVVEYDRQAFCYEFGDVRITFDSNVRTSRSNLDLFDSDMQFISVYPDVVMEVKYTGFFPEILSDILSDVNPIRDSVSKYYLSAEEIE